MKSLKASTRHAYAGWESRFSAAKCSKDQNGAEKYLNELAQRLSPSSTAQAKCALERHLGCELNFTPEPRRKQLPSWLSRAEMLRLLSRMSGTTRLMAEVCYSGGLKLHKLMAMKTKGGAWRWSSVQDVSKPMHPDTFRNALAVAAKKARIKKHVTPQVLRNTAIYESLQRTGLTLSTLGKFSLTNTGRWLLATK